MIAICRLARKLQQGGAVAPTMRVRAFPSGMPKGPEGRFGAPIGLEVWLLAAQACWCI